MSPESQNETQRPRERKLTEWPFSNFDGLFYCCRRRPRLPRSPPPPPPRRRCRRRFFLFLLLVLLVLVRFVCVCVCVRHGFHGEESLVNTAPGMMPPVQRKRRSQVWRPDKLDQTNWYCNYKAPLCRLSDSSQSSSRWCPFPFEPCRKDGEELSIPKTSAGLRGELAKRICNDFPTFRLFFFPEQLIHSPRCILLGSPWTAQTFWSNNQTYQRSTSKSCHDTWVFEYWRTVPPSWSGLVFLKGARSWATQRPGFFLASSMQISWTLSAIFARTLVDFLIFFDQSVSGSTWSMRQQLGSSDQSRRESKCNSLWTAKDLVTDLNPNKFAVKLNVKDRKFGCGTFGLFLLWLELESGHLSANEVCGRPRRGPVASFWRFEESNWLDNCILSILLDEYLKALPHMRKHSDSMASLS